MSNPEANQEELPKRRLIICLDGTWNDKDSSTNVNAFHNLILKKGNDGIEQIPYYDTGVGTGVLDSITGGGFGFGLDKNVREAYNWLIENYRYGDDIFIFGFSRGSYTARSLVGFISRCGLLLPGAPLTVEQLWKGYGLLGREREDKGANFWEKAAGQLKRPFRQITSLKNDFWDKSPHPVDRPINLTERLLVEWSRRIPIHFLGIFDTVGAMGWDALAIPGLRSKVALHHNMRVTSILQNCYHALAIDENRSSFAHTPIQQWFNSRWRLEEDKDKKERGVEKERSEWAARVHQKWFVGAHSNIGGGYENDLLAGQPLRWMLDGASGGDKKDGLQLVPWETSKVPDQASQREDSYAQFAAPIWTAILRAKRNYRRINPPAEIRKGYALECINEAIHPRTLDLAESDPDYCPPNLIEYARRAPAECGTSVEKNSKLKELATIDPDHRWLETHEFVEKPDAANKTWDKASKARSVIIGWSILGAVGLVALNGLFRGTSAEAPSTLFLALFAALMVLIDWAECRFNATLALKPENGLFRAARDSVYWLRAIGVIFFSAGALVFAGGIFTMGWAAYKPETSAGTLLATVWPILKHWWLAPVAAAGAVLYADVIDKKFRPAIFVPAVIAAPVILIAAGIIISLAGFWLGKSIWYISGPPSAEGFQVGSDLPATGEPSSLAGWLLLLQLALILLAKGFSWVGQPMKTAGIGSIVQLQKTWSPEKVGKQLKNWREMLTCEWHSAEKEKKAGLRLHEVVSESIHRDNVGLIPLYTMVLGLGMWIAASQLGWNWLGFSFLCIPVWGWIALLTAAADYVENGTHLHYLKNFSISGIPGRGRWLVGISGTLVKTIGFFAGLFISASALIEASGQVIFGDELMTWRGAVAGTISLLAAITVAILIVARIRRWIAEKL